MDWKSRTRAAFVPPAPVPEDDVIEELAQHVRAVYDAARADGLPHDQADRRVAEHLERWQRDAGALRHRRRRPAIVESPPTGSPSRLAGLARDIRYAGRLLRRQPRFALLAMATIALGITATTVLFSVTYGVLMKPLPWPHSSRLLALEETRGGNRPRFGAFSSTVYLAWREQSTTIDGIAAWALRTVTLSGAGDPERMRIATVSASLFPVLGTRPLAGTLFDGEAAVVKDANVVVLSEGLWRQRYGADPEVVGAVVRFDGQPYRVVGVLPDRLAFPDRLVKAWVPLVIAPGTGHSLSMINAIARLAPGATAAQAAAEGTARGRVATDTGMTTMAIFGGVGPIAVTAAPLRDALTSEVRRPLLVLLVAGLLLLGTATANVAGLQLARAASRGRELAIRAAIGAGQARIMRQVLVEHLLLGLAGGAAGLVLAWLVFESLPSVLPADFPRADGLGVGPAGVLFALAASVLTSGAFGALPALRLRRLDLVAALAQGGSAPAGGSRAPGAWLRITVIAGQVAMACVLLIGASLLGRTFVALVTADRGYDPSGVLTARLSLPGAIYTPEQKYVVLRRILDRLADMPAVAAVGFTSELPLTPGGSTSAFEMQSPRGAAQGGRITVQASPRLVSPGYFSALGMRILDGRGFSEADTEAAEPVAVVNASFARRYLGESPIGARLPMGVGYGIESVEATLVGIVDDVKYVTGAGASHPEVYYSYRQLGGRIPVPVVTLLVRTPEPLARLAASIRTAVREADPHLVPEAILPMEARMLASLARPRLYAILLGSFAASALLITAVGLFAVLSYTVAQRSHELAVRTALGARPIDIVTLVLREGLAITGLGLAAGLLGSLAFARAVEALLYGVVPLDAVTYLGVLLLILSVAAAASLGPAWRASRLEPPTVLRA